MEPTGLIRARLQQIETYIDRNGYESYDPYDGLISPFPCRMFGTSQMMLRIWQQTVRLSPFDIRPLIAVHKLDHTKTISDFASAYAVLYKITQKEKYSQQARQMLEWLIQIGTKTAEGYGWGLRFPYTTRFVNADIDTLNSYQTVNAIIAFLDGYEFLGDSSYLGFALQGFLFMEKAMGYTDYGDRMSWTYWKTISSEVHNINGLMLGMISRLSKLDGEIRYQKFIHKLYRSLCVGQNQDGSWFYSVDNRGAWVDGFHTGFILEGISRAILAGLIEPDNHFHKAVDYFKRALLLKNGMPKYYPDNTYPIDAQNCAQAIQTLCFLIRLGQARLQELAATLEAVDHALWNPKGFYNHLRTKWWVYKTPMHRWGTGPMFLSLAYARGICEGKL